MKNRNILIYYLVYFLIFHCYTMLFGQQAQTPYPIIFVHGLVGSDATFRGTMEYMRDEFNLNSIYVFDMVLNADNNNSTANLNDDVKWVDFVFDGNSIEVGRRHFVDINGAFADDPNDFVDGWSDVYCRLFAINFQEERIRGASQVNDLFDGSNQSAIYKQGYALSAMIEEVLDFTEASKVILVGHSMGGLAIREYLQRTEIPDGSQDGIAVPRWWDSTVGHKVAKVVTIGTPHLGSNAWFDPTVRNSRSIIPDGNSESLRDLKYWFDSYIDPDFGDEEYEEFCGSGLTNEDAPGIYLFGGYEVCVTEDEWEQNDPFGNADFNCDGDENGYIVGINLTNKDNPDMNLPTDIAYTWITSNPGYGEGDLLEIFLPDFEPGIADPIGNPGDGCVILSKQYLYTGDEIEPIGIADTLLTNRIHIREGSDSLSILRGLDEPDQSSHAYELASDGTTYLGFTTYQPGMIAEDIDYFYFNSMVDGYASINISNVFNTAIWEFEALTFTDEVHIFSIDQGSGVGSGAMSFAVNSGGNYLLKFTGTALQQSFENPYNLEINITGNDDGLVAYYPFNGDATDESGNGNNGTVNGAIPATDRFGNTQSAYSFTGELQTIDFDNTSGDLVLDPANAFTISLWIEPETGDDGFIFGNLGATNGDFRVTFRRTDESTIELYVGKHGFFNDVITINSIGNGESHHLAVVSDGTSFIGYHNGLPVATQPFVNALSSNPNNTGYLAGRYFLSPYYQYFGKVDDIRIYNRSLAESEIQSLYHENGWDIPIPETISNITAAQRTDGSQLVDIYYDLSGTSQYYQVSAEASLDGGNTYNPTSSASGDISFGVTPGMGKHIVWDVGTEYPDQFTISSKISITALENSIPPGACVDIDGNVYQTIQIGNQVWMAENLRVTHYRNGDAIPNITNNGDWGSLSTGGYGVYNNDQSNADIYGNLYNWYAVNDSRTIAPEGWHAPTDAEWKELEMALGMSQSEADDTGLRGTNEGSKLAGNADLWNNGNLENNSEFGSSGFTALPGGTRYYGSGSYRYIGRFGFFWSATEGGSNGYAWYRVLYYYNSDITRYVDYKRNGLSVRCVRD